MGQVLEHIPGAYGQRQGSPLNESPAEHQPLYEQLGGLVPFTRVPQFLPLTGLP